MCNDNDELLKDALKNSSGLVVKGLQLKPTNCACGGNVAFIYERTDGIAYMIGCECHTTVKRFVEVFNEYCI